MRYPDFFGIGAQKAGTTWLHQALADHPRLWLPPLKEIHYFDVLHLDYRKDPESGLTGMDKARMERALRAIERAATNKKVSIEKMKLINLLSHIGLRGLTDEWYGAIFRTAPPETKCGEITPEYALLPDEGISHMLRLAPKARFIFILRDPIERGWSDLRMMRQRPGAKAFSEEQRIRSKDFFARGDYLATIERFRRHVSEENFLVLYFDHIAKEPQRLLQSVCAFLGVSFDEAEFGTLNEPVHQGEQTPLPPDLYDACKIVLKPAYDRLRTLDNSVVEAWHRRHYG